MSHSIHANRSRGQRRQTGETDWQALRTKRSYKAAALTQRRQPEGQAAITSAKDVPIHVVDVSPHLFFPAGIDDMRAVLEALPQGVTTGLREIRLEIGRRLVSRVGDSYDMVEPRFGRKSFETVPGVFAPVLMGIYLASQQSIRLFGYTKAPGLRLSRRQQIWLELEMLDTLVHEVIHHHDRVHRMPGSRSWRGHWSKTEEYTERLTQRWVLEVVLPHLRGKYGEADTLRLQRLVLRPRDRRRWRAGLSVAERHRARQAARGRFPTRTEGRVAPGRS